MAFGVLCEVQLRHDYWLNRDGMLHEAVPAAQQARLRRAQPDYIVAAPTPETRAVLAGHGMLFKKTPRGFLIGAELQAAANAPRRPLGPADRLRVALRLADPDFAAYTAGIAPDFYLFSTATGSERGGELHLSRPVPVHDSARAYDAGEIRADYAGPLTRLFQARRDTGPSPTPIVADWEPIPAATHDPAVAYLRGDVVLSDDRLFEAAVDGPGPSLGDAAQWTDLGPLANQYATAADRLPLHPPVFAVDVAAAGAVVLEATVTRDGAGQPALRQRFENGGPLATAQVDLRELPDGRYRLDWQDAGGAPIAALAEDFYLSGRAVAEGWFGLVEIGSGAGAFALLDPAGDLRSPRFELRFLNRSARPRYRFPAQQPVGAGAEVAPDPSDPSVLVAPAVRPVTHVGQGVMLRADDVGTPAVIERILLPHRAPPALRKQGGEWFSDIHLPNLPPLG